MDILERMQSLPVVTASGSQFHQVSVTDMAELLDEIVKLREVSGGVLRELKALRKRFHACCMHAGNDADIADAACSSADAAISAAEKAGIPFPR